MPEDFSNNGRHEPEPEHKPGRRIRSKQTAMPVEVVILTRDHEIQGIIYVSREAKEERRISDLLNDPEKRFLAVTDATLTGRTGPSTPRVYSFLQLHIDNIIMIHPSTQAVVRKGGYSKDEALKFDNLRSRMNRSAAV